MSYGSAKSSGSSSESESSAYGSSSSAYGSSSSSSESGVFYDSSSAESSSSSSSGSSSSGGNPFGSMIVDLIGINSFPPWWQFDFENVPEYFNQDGGSPYYMSMLSSPGPDIIRILVRLDLAYLAEVIGYGTPANFSVYANHPYSGSPLPPLPGLRVEVTYMGVTDWVEVDPVTYKDSPPATGTICPITVWEDGTFALD